MNGMEHSRWRIAAGYKILNRHFGDQYAIYHCGSGDTHLLDSIPFFVLKKVSEGVQSFEQLLATVKEEFEYESPDQPRDYLQSVLIELQNLNIIERLAA